MKRLAIAPIPPELFYASSDKRDDAWLQHLETLRKPVGYLLVLVFPLHQMHRSLTRLPLGCSDTYEEFPRQEYRLSRRSNEPDERVVVMVVH